VQQTHERVAENGVAQMPDVRRLVGIDAGVLDQNFSRGSFRCRLLVGRERGSHPSAIDSHIQISRRRDLHFGDAVDRTDFGADRLGDLQRRRAQRFGEGKNRNGEVAEFDFRRLLNNNRRQSDAGISALQALPHALSQ
jgi:hypothetical protein